MNHWKLERWHKEDVIPRPVVEHLGYGMGTRSTYPAQTPAQILAVCRLLKQTRKFAVVRFRLWQEGYFIPLPVLKETIRQLVPQLKWEVPRREDQKYKAVARQIDTLLQKTGGRFFRYLFKRFGKNLENLRSFIEIQLCLMYGIDYIFEPSHHKGELSAADILARGLSLEELWFLPADLTADFQHASDKGLLSIQKMNTTLDKATEEDLRQANTRAEVIPLIFEGFELLGFMPKLLHSLRTHLSADPSVQALFLVFVLHLAKNGYADNIDGLLEVFRVQVPRLRAFQALCFALQQEAPAVAKELGSPQRLLRQIKGLSQPEREQYLAQRTEHLREVYLQHQTEIDAFWQPHPEIENALETGDPSSP